MEGVLWTTNPLNFKEQIDIQLHCGVARAAWNLSLINISFEEALVLQVQRG
jgi:hypothetical protein